MRLKHWSVFSFVIFILAACSTGQPALPAAIPSETSPSPAAIPASSTVPQATIPATIAPTNTLTLEPSATPLPAHSWVFPPYGAGGTKAWQVNGDQVTEVALPELGTNQYDHSPLTGKILHSSSFPAKGAGPANLAVGDLLVYDVSTKQDQVIFKDENIVEAVFAPNGQDIVYLQATPTTYELHYRTQNGEDRLLATDVSPTFSISLDGKSVVFTRETGYKVGVPGVYIVPVAGGSERKIGASDRGGTGSVADLPLWSPDGQYILLSVPSPDAPTHWMLIKTDGTAEIPVKPALEVADWFKNTDYAFYLWLPDSQHVLASQIQGQMGPPNSQETVIANLDLASGQVNQVIPVDYGNTFPLAWDKPGQTVWMLDDMGDIRYLDLKNPTPLPQSCKVKDDQLFVNPYKGYCFSYPQDVTIQAFEYERPLFLGPALDKSVEPLQSRLWVEVTPLSTGTDLKAAVDQFIAAQPQGNPAITRQPFTLGGEPAEVLENVPGQLFSRVVLAVHNDKLYALWFNPVDSSVPQVQPEVDKLFQAVTGSFAYLPK